VYLEQTSLLPYRYVVPISSESKYAIEHTFTELEVNQSLSDADFKLDPHFTADTVRIFEQAYLAPNMPTFNSIREAQQQAGFALFEPDNGVLKDVATIYYIEKQSRRTPVIRAVLGNSTLTQGLYIPVASDHYSLRFGEILDDKHVSAAQIDGQPAEWRTGPNGELRLRLEREGTWIEIRAPTKEEAIDIAKSLKAVE
jgi:hypothetical protein